MRTTIGLCIPLLSVLALAIGAPAGENTTVVRPPDTGIALANPGMGWVLHHYLHPDGATRRREPVGCALHTDSQPGLRPEPTR